MVELIGLCCKMTAISIIVTNVCHPSYFNPWERYHTNKLNKVFDELKHNIQAKTMQVYIKRYSADSKGANVTLHDKKANIL